MQLLLSDAQVRLLVELLEGEQKKLLIEIRHTDTRTFRDGLKERLAQMESLIRQIESVQAQGV